MWEFAGIIASHPYQTVLQDSPSMIGAKWFSGSRLNFAENLLRCRDDRTAIVFKSEALPATRITYAGLYKETARMASALRHAGIRPGDRIAGYVPNMTQAVIAMLGAASIGAIWSSCSPDFGIRGVLDRFGQIQPRILFTADGYYYNGQKYDCLPRIEAIVRDLPDVEKIVVVPYLSERADISRIPRAVHYHDFVPDVNELSIEFEQLPFDHPLYIMYSSGTTGLPKCMVHSAGGTLIQHMKEQLLHVDLNRPDNLFYFTTCGWMMWNWLVSGLAAGATLTLFDGSPFFPGPASLFRLIEQERITIFGTSPRYLTSVEKSGLKPGEKFDLSSLKTILSTGAPLSEESFRFVYRDVKPDVRLSSISGGTDIISCFALGCPILPVYAGEMQCRGLGMKVEAYDPNGQPVIGEQGELVCTASFPSMPIGFWDDPGNAKYRKAFFEVYPNVWHHGDYVLIKKYGGVVISGRSDATLNAGGVRIGTAEIYRIVEAMVEIADSIVVGQPHDGDVRVVLFVKLAPGFVLDDELKNRIRANIRDAATPRHVPALILPVSDVPVTLNGKKVELAVRNVIEGRPVTNRDALANPEALDQFASFEELRPR